MHKLSMIHFIKLNIVAVSVFFAGIVVCGLVSIPCYGQGVALRAVSAVNEGMGGVATATPVDSIGALNWNAATLSAFEKSDMSFGTSAILANSEVSSQFLGRSGSTKSDTGAVLGPYMGMVMKDPEKRVTYGFGIFAIGGAQVNYPGDPSNPILNQTTGIGRTSAKVELFQMVPAASFQITDRLSVGLAPSSIVGRLIAEPMFFGPRDSTMTRWGQGAGTRYIWGAGFQIGAYYKGAGHMNYGFAFKSKQWTEKFPYNITFADGSTTTAHFKLRYPSILTFGWSWDGLEKTILGADIRYFDYSNALGFAEKGYHTDGSVKGLGWRSVWAVSVALQREITDRLTCRIGYSWNENPITGETILTNVPCPMIQQHGLHLGATFEFLPEWYGTIGYAHMFESTVKGSNPLWSVDPNNSICSKASADVISFGVNKSF
ncbi:MAG: outer membrane protein transport protein [Planctomycetia bacterium]|nr:outer membrane protein transport protein [Planctomycetia bacterium]